MNDAVFVDFFRNGTYTMQFHDFDFGEYELKDSVITLTNNNDNTRKLSYQQDSKEDQKKFSLFKENKTDGFYKMKRIKNYNGGGYPFVLNNNLWRVKSTKKETTNEIINRPQNHLQYLEK